MHNKLSRFLTAVAVGCGIETFWIISMYLFRPDPPFDLLDIIFLLSQMPGGLIVAMLSSATSGSPGNNGIFGALFVFQSPFYVMLAWWIINRRERG